MDILPQEWVKIFCGNEEKLCEWRQYFAECSLQAEGFISRDEIVVQKCEKLLKLTTGREREEETDWIEHMREDIERNKRILVASRQLRLYFDLAVDIVKGEKAAK